MMGHSAGSSMTWLVTSQPPRRHRSGSVNTKVPRRPKRPSSPSPTRSFHSSIEHTSDREIRVFQVLKLRGSGFISGKHAYRVSNDGIDIFPRLADHEDGATYDFAVERISSGVSILDNMLADGYWRGASTLVAGPSGAGKTLVALHFIFSGAALGEQGIFATFQENPDAAGADRPRVFLVAQEPKVELMFRPPVDLYLDEWVYELLDLIERTGAKRVAIDSLGDLRAACGDEIRFREYMYSFLQRCARRNVSVIMTQEVPELFGITRLSEFGISHVSDNVVLLQFLRGNSEVKRAITVLKTRGSAHDPRIRQFEITSGGLSLGDQFLQTRACFSLNLKGSYPLGSAVCKRGRVRAIRPARSVQYGSVRPVPALRVLRQASRPLH